MIRREAGLISRRPQGAFVAGGARRRRLSWLRPQAARWQRGVAGTDLGRLSTNPHKFARILFVFVRFVSIRGQSMGASRRHETAQGAVHESPRARDVKASELGFWEK